MKFRSGRMRERRVFASPFTRQRETHENRQQSVSVVTSPADMALRTGTTSKVEFVNAEVLRVAPDEVLIISIPDDEVLIPGENPSFLVDQMLEGLAAAGLKDRVLIIIGGNTQFAVVKKDEAPDAV